VADRTDERYQVSDASILFEDTWACEEEEAVTRPCPVCGFATKPGDIRCARCNALVITGCSGSCGACGSRTCSGDKKR
jgi:hypothetical protein